jgi:hypothetical protein
VVQSGDVIVAGSDGLLDNLSEHELTEEVGPFWGGGFL